MVITAPFSMLYVPGKLIVRGNAAATADNILAHETMFRLSIFGDLVGQRNFHLSRHRAISLAQRREQNVGCTDGRRSFWFRPQSVSSTLSITSRR